MSFNNVIPGFIARDPEKLASLVEHMYTEDPVLPGMESWAPEDESDEPEYVEDVGVTSVIYRVVDEKGQEYKSGRSTALNKPYYSTERGAKSAATYMRNRLDINARVQKGSVTWE